MVSKSESTVKPICCDNCGREITLEAIWVMRNGETLCWECHAKKYGGRVGG